MADPLRTNSSGSPSHNYDSFELIPDGDDESLGKSVARVNKNSQSWVTNNKMALFLAAVPLLAGTGGAVGASLGLGFGAVAVISSGAALAVALPYIATGAVMGLAVGGLIGIAGLTVYVAFKALKIGKVYLEGHLERTNDLNKLNHALIQYINYRDCNEEKLFQNLETFNLLINEDVVLNEYTKNINDLSIFNLSSDRNLFVAGIINEVAKLNLFNDITRKTSLLNLGNDDQNAKNLIASLPENEAKVLKGYFRLMLDIRENVKEVQKEEMYQAISKSLIPQDLNEAEINTLKENVKFLMDNYEITFRSNN